MIRRAAALRSATGEYWFIGALMAVSLATFSEAFVRGSVASVIIIFYSAPVWATLFARWLLGESITRQRIAAIILGLAGVATIVGEQAGLPLPSTMSEWLSLTSSITWTLALTLIRRAPDIAPLHRTLAVAPFLGPAVLLVAWCAGSNGFAGEAGVDVSVWLWAGAFGLLWVLPIIAATVFAATWMSPGRVAILMMFEVIVGLVSAALFATEIIGVRELVGVALVLLAGFTEFMPLTSRQEPIR